MANASLCGKTALVTGSTSGIGLGIATRLAGLGANLAVFSSASVHVVRWVHGSKDP